MLSDDLAQFGLAQLRRIYNLCGTFAHGGELLPLTRDPLGDACLGCQGMRAARLLIAANDHVVRRLNEEELIGNIPCVEFVEDLHERIKKLAAARIHNDSGTTDLPVRFAAEIDEFRNKDRRQIIYAKIAEILHIARCERFSPARHARNDHGAELLCGLCLLLTHLVSPHISN